MSRKVKVAVTIALLSGIVLVGSAVPYGQLLDVSSGIVVGEHWDLTQVLPNRSPGDGRTVVTHFAQGTPAARIAAIQGAHTTWEGVVAMDFDDVGNTLPHAPSNGPGGGTPDGFNTHSFEFTFGAGGPLAVTPTVTLASTGQIVEADVFYEGNAGLVAWDTTGSPGVNDFDVEGTAVHEMGHFIGLAHSGDFNSTMFPSIAGGSASLEPRSLEPDDDVSATRVYAQDGGDVSIPSGGISGRVSHGDDANDGIVCGLVYAFPVSEEPITSFLQAYNHTYTGSVVGATLSSNTTGPASGSYQIDGLPDDDYMVFLIPTDDGVITAAQISAHCANNGESGFAREYWNGIAESNNEGDTFARVAVTVSGGQVTTGINLITETGTGCVNSETPESSCADGQDNDCDGLADCDDSNCFTDPACTGGCTIHADCDDSNPCTDDACNGGTCEHTNNSVACDDGNPCTVGDVCSGGGCLSGPPPDCSSSGDQCNTVSCDAGGAVGNCAILTFANEGLACDDGLFCNTGETCTSGVCEGGSATDCSTAGNQCNTGVCNETDDICEALPDNEGLACDDGLFCNTGETCTSGVCAGGSATNCSGASDQCNIGVCNETADACEGQPVTDGTTCDDGAFCTAGETCTSGVCGGGTPTDCSGLADQCNDGTCNETTDACQAQAANEGGACDDGEFCTVGEVCSAGMCGGGAARDCSSLDDQCNSGVCNDTTNACEAQPVANGTSCDDGNLCTTSDECTLGACAGTAVTCPQGESCDPGDGVCKSCLNNNDCDDSNACTDDVCSGGECEFTNNTDPCDDSDACTIGDTCGGGTCSGTQVDCTAFDDQCNVGVCNAGTCEAQPGNEGAACDDGLFCTTGETCSSGVCGGGSATDCSSAGDQCNSGVCNETTDACEPQPANEGAACNDGLFCTVGEACSAGTCTGGSPTDCSGAGDQCNTGVCNETTNACEAQSANEGAACTDGAFCTVGEACTAGACGGGSPRDCSGAGDQCNTGVCNETTDACEAQPANEGLACDDGLFCTSNEVCTAGVCTGGSATDCSGLDDQCNAGGCNETTDVCEAQAANEGGACDDGRFCTTGETCSDGECEGGSTTDCTFLDDECISGVCNEINDACEAQPVPDGTPCGDPTSNACTNPDACDGAGTCLPLHTTTGTPCDDGDVCTENDVCTVGDCGGTPIGGCTACTTNADCDDGNVCTDDVCTIGQTCEHTNNSNSCVDGNVCTTNDFCSFGSCVGIYSTGCCNTNDECNDYNDCTDDICTLPAHLCTHVPLAPGTTCGSGADTDCTDPDTCDGNGACQSNDAAKGSSCLSSEGCLVGKCDQVTFEVNSLPEVAFAGSVPVRGSCNNSTAFIAGYSLDDFGIEKPTTWESSDGGANWTSVPLDLMGYDKGRASGIACDESSGECVAVGWLGLAGRDPIFWTRNPTSGIWTGNLAPVPPGFVGGQMNYGALGRDGVSAARGVSPFVAAGTAIAPDGTSKAVVWLDVTGLAPPLVLNEFAAAPGIEGSANDVMVDPVTGVLSVAGYVSDAANNHLPAVWRESQPGVFELFVIALPLGAIGGQLNGFDGDLCGSFEFGVFGEVETADGAKLGMLWSGCGADYTTCTSTALLPLPPLQNSTVSNRICSTDDGPGLKREFSGSSSAVGDPLGGVATRWEVDVSSGTPVVIDKTDINNLVTGLSNGCTVTHVSDFVSIDSFCVLDGLLATQSCLARRLAGGPRPRAIVLTPLRGFLGIDNNRYVSFRPSRVGPVAYKLDMVSSLFHPTATVSGWVGVPDANGIASLEASPVTRTWTESIVTVTKCDLAPVAEFELRASTDGGATFSPPGTFRTTARPGGGKWWGDTVGVFDGTRWTPPQGITNIDDAVGAIKSWQGAAGAPEIPRTDVEPQEPNRAVNFNDVFTIVGAFQGNSYPFGCPDDPCQDNLTIPCP